MYESQQVILATPQYINIRILKERKINLDNFYYNPWVVATLILSQLPDGVGERLSWDNVIFKGKGLGYIFNQHQNLSSHHDKIVVTYYTSIDDIEPNKRRKYVYSKSKDYWKKYILDDFKIAHKEIEELVESIEINIWGHGMISPRPNFVWSEDRLQACQPIENKVFFAHTDLCGVSNFEEAFNIGINTANNLLNK
jgi:hypothetical protein